MFYKIMGYNFGNFDVWSEKKALFALYVKSVPFPKTDPHGLEPCCIGLVTSQDGENWKELPISLDAKTENEWELNFENVSVSKRKLGGLFYAVCNDILSTNTDLVLNRLTCSEPWALERTDEKQSIVVQNGQLGYGFENLRPVIYCFENEGNDFILFNAQSGNAACLGLIKITGKTTFEVLKPLITPAFALNGEKVSSLYLTKRNNLWYCVVTLEDELGKNSWKVFTSPKLLGSFVESAGDLSSADGFVNPRVIEFGKNTLVLALYLDEDGGRLRSRLTSMDQIQIKSLFKTE